MRSAGSLGAVLALLLLGHPGVGLAAEVPVTVSPGSPAGARVESRCPTFSWGTVPGAEGYELVVRRLADGGGPGRPVLRATLPGSASLWTPSLDACFERGGRYEWRVRAVGAGAASGWSAPRRFEVASILSREEVGRLVPEVRRALGVGQSAPGAGVEGRDGSSSSSGSVAGRGSGPPSGLGGAPAPLASVAGDPLLLVNGAAVVTTATLGAGLCEALTYRYVDQGDGTIRDCKTGRIWLKDASCLGSGTWDDAAGPGSAQELVVRLNGGEQFNCADYQPGTYTDWVLPPRIAFCSGTESFGPPCSAAAAATSLIDSTVSGAPKVADARGTGAWSEGDAFSAVSPTFGVCYWSSSCFESCSIDAIRIDLNYGTYAPVAHENVCQAWPVRGGP